MNILIEYLRKAAGCVPLTSASAIVQAALRILPKQLSDIPAFPGLLDSRHKQQHQREFAVCWAALSSGMVEE